tara:strand:+ start:1714 stop:2049 length:336 start_codon:yes stop_codon:yes gene_type:complete
MSYELSFSQEFFQTHMCGAAVPGTEEGTVVITGEHWSDDPVIQKPKSVYQALVAMSHQEWHAVCEILGKHSDMVSIDDMLRMVQKTNTCSNLSTPVEVWIDPEGWHTIKVY